MEGHIRFYPPLGHLVSVNFSFRKSRNLFFNFGVCHFTLIMDVTIFRCSSLTEQAHFLFLRLFNRVLLLADVVGLLLED